jgi:uncharacterized membrane protein YfcA
MKFTVTKLALCAALLLICLISKADASNRCLSSGVKYQCPNCGGIEVSDCFKCDGYVSTDNKHDICIDRKLFQPYNADPEDHDDHYHFLWNDLFGALVWFFMGGIATACGVGGGGIYVPLGILLIQFSPKQASGLSQCSIFGATLGGLILNVQDRHPANKITDAPGVVDEKGRIVQGSSNTPNDSSSETKLYTRPRINYDMTLYLAPIEMAGAVLGVLIQIFLPNWAYLMVAGIVLSVTAYKTYGKFWDARKKELQAEQNARDLKVKEEAIGETLEDGPNEKQSDTTGTNVPVESVEQVANAGVKVVQETSEAVKTDGSFSTEEDSEADATLRKTYLEADMRQYPTDKIAGLIVLLIVVFILTLLRGGKGVESLVGITCESTWYSILIIVQFTWLFSFAGYFATRLLADQKKRVAVRYPYQPDDVVWNAKSLRVFGIFTFFAGVIAGLIGIGGGMVRDKVRSYEVNCHCDQLTLAAVFPQIRFWAQ